MGEYADMALESQMWLGDSHWIDDEEQAEYFGFGEPRYYSQRRPSGPGKCPKCGAKTVLKTGKFGEFYGCITFPKCKGSRDKGKLPSHYCKECGMPPHNCLCGHEED